MFLPEDEEVMPRGMASRCPSLVVETPRGHEARFLPVKMVTGSGPRSQDVILFIVFVAPL